MDSFYQRRAFKALSLGLVAIILTYFAYNKIGYHVDELYSYGLSNSYDGPFPNQTNQWLKGNYYFQYLTTEWHHRFNYFKVYYNQVQDVHPPLYYFLFHTVASFFPGTFNQWLGLTLNYVTHLGSVILLWKIARCLTDKEWLIWWTGIFWGVSMGGINTFLFIRMYSLATFLGLIFLYQAIQLIHAKKPAFNKLIAFSLILFLGVMTHYYFLIYAFFVVGSLMILELLQKHLEIVAWIGASGILGVSLAYLFFPAMKNHLTQSNRGTETYDNLLNQNLFTNLNQYLDFLGQDLFGGLPWVLLGFVFLIGGLVPLLNRRQWSNNKHQFPIYLIIITVVAYFTLIQVISHYVTPRYIYLIYPLIVILMMLALEQISTYLVHKKPLIVLGLTGICLWGLWSQKPTYSFPSQAQVMELSKKNQALPVITISDKKWKNISLVPELVGFQDIYPWTTKEITQGDVPILKSEMKDHPLLIFVQHPKINIPATINVLKESYDYTQAKILYQDEKITMLRLDK